MARTDHHRFSTPDPIRVCHKLDRQARPAGRVARVVEAELAAHDGGVEPFDLTYVPAEDEPSNESYWDDFTDFCHVCLRVTDHVAEHDDLLWLGVTYQDGGIVMCSPLTRYVIQEGFARV